MIILTRSKSNIHGLVLSFGTLFFAAKCLPLFLCSLCVALNGFHPQQTAIKNAARIRFDYCCLQASHLLISPERLRLIKQEIFARIVPLC